MANMLITAKTAPIIRTALLGWLGYPGKGGMFKEARAEGATGSQPARFSIRSRTRKEGCRNQRPTRTLPGEVDCDVETGRPQPPKSSLTVPPLSQIRRPLASKRKPYQRAGGSCYCYSSNWTSRSRPCSRASLELSSPSLL